MSRPDPVSHAAAWAYQGVWGILTNWFRVPRLPPNLPTAPGESTTTLRPSYAWLRYLKFEFCLGAGFWASALTIGVVASTVALPLVGALIALPAAIVLACPSALAYLALHLRYDTTWYVLSSRSMRIRRGIWIVSETTITYDNIQNVSVTQGPLQRYFGIANVVVQTAGGGGHAGPHGAGMSTHVGLLEGLTNAPEIRELIMLRARRAAGAGLGDDQTTDERESHHRGTAAGEFSSAHLQALRDIRDALREAVAN